MRKQRANSDILRLKKIAYSAGMKRWAGEFVTGTTKTESGAYNTGSGAYNTGSESESRSVLSTLCNPTDYTVHGILQARILEWVAVPFSRGSSQPRD